MAYEIRNILFHLSIHKSIEIDNIMGNHYYMQQKQIHIFTEDLQSKSRKENQKKESEKRISSSFQLNEIHFLLSIFDQLARH